MSALARKGSEVGTDTVLRWYRDLLLRRRAARSKPRRPGRPPTVRSIRVLVLRPASGMRHRFWRQPLTRWLTEFTDAGFILERIHEHQPVDEMAHRHPEEYARLSRAPGFIASVSSRPRTSSDAAADHSSTGTSNPFDEV